MTEKKFPDKNVKYLWNNIIKIGKAGEKGWPPDYIYDIELQTFRVVKEEIEIIQPDIALFFTGPDYDICIENNFGKIGYTAINSYTKRELSKIDLKNTRFAFRTYHPTYLRFSKKEGDVYQTILQQIKL